jgi:hypothetical protein
MVAIRYRGCMPKPHIMLLLDQVLVLIEMEMGIEGRWMLREFGDNA